MPTTMASTRPRSQWTISRDSTDEIQRLSPLAVAMRPSRLIAHLAITHGFFCSTSLRKGAVSRVASRSQSPASTAMPAARSAAMPPPFTAGKGSRAAITTRAMPAATTASVQGGVLPW
jgi:hypothetical protein